VCQMVRKDVAEHTPMMRFKVLFVCLMLLASIAAAGTLLFGQGQAGGLRGTVSDPTGAAIPGAAVRAVSISTGVATSTVSTGAGLYNLTPLPPGVYRLEAEKAGFKTLVRDNVTVPLAVVVGLDVTLEVGATTQTVEVHGAAPTVEKETTQLNTSVNPKTYLDLPLSAGNGRSPIRFMSLAPGNYSFGGGTQTANGGQVWARQLRIDGMDVGNVLAQPGDDNKTMTMPPDALQEFTFITGDPPAEFGNQESGIVNFTVRSGTNQLHGSAYEFNTGNYLQARNFLQRNLTRYNRNEYGFTLGGPVLIPHVYDGRNRTFWFFNFNGWSTRSKPQSSFTTLPTAQEAQGDFSDFPLPIYDPATTTRLANGTYTRQQFSCNGRLNVICPDRISPISAKIAAAYPTVPNGSPITNNYLSQNVNQQGFKDETFKIDEILNERHRFSFTYNHWASPQRSCNIFCFLSGATPGGADIASGILQWSRFIPKHNFDHLNYDATISPTTLLHITAGLERYSQCYYHDTFGKGWDKIVGIPNTGNGPFPYVGFGTVVNYGAYPSPGIGGTGDNECYIGTVPQINENFTLVRGRHTIKFGGEHQFFGNEHTQPTTTGSFQFTGLETGQPGVALSGNSFASFLLGDVNTGSRHVQDINTYAIYWAQGLFVQDAIKLTPKLTVNVGVRWALYAPLYDRGDNLSMVDLTVPNPGAGGRLGAMVFAGSGSGRTGNRRLVTNLYKKNFVPRLGVAYAVKPTLVVRTGYAITDMAPGTAGSNGLRWSDLGFTADPTFTSQNAGVTPAFQWDSGFPAFIPPPFISPTFALGSQVNTFSGLNAAAPAYLQQWHFNIQENFKPNWLLDVGYVGSKGTRLYSGNININQVDSKYLSLGPLLQSSITDPAVIAAGFTPPLPGFRGTLAQALRPYPQYAYIQTGGQIGAPFLGGAQDGNSTYHSLQVKLQHNFSNGLYLLSTYTWQKFLTNAPSTPGAGAGQVPSGGGFLGVSPRDQYRRYLEHALGPVPPQMLNIAFNYELPFGPGKQLANSTNKVVSALVRGWEINGILGYSAGLPVVVTAPNTNPIFSDIQFPSIVSGVPQILNHHITDPRLSGQLYLNPAAFAAPSPFTIGNAPAPLNVRSLASLGEDLSLVKRIYFVPNHESTNLELRLETFNAFNRHIFTCRGGSIGPGLGQCSGVSGGRTAQLAAKIVF
jgi:Carboxypeptidase regulatory-like domain